MGSVDSGAVIQLEAMYERYWMYKRYREYRYAEYEV